MDYTCKYREITNNLIKKSFPKLKNKRILIFELNSSKSFSATTSYFLFFSVICVNKKSRKYSSHALDALFVHELNHIEIIEKINFLQKIVFGLKWLFFKQVRANFETQADLLVIKKGYGNHLYKLKQESWKNKTKAEIEKSKKRGYLTPKEIKSHMRKI